MIGNTWGIVGSRNVFKSGWVEDVLTGIATSSWYPDLVVSGGAIGTDTLAESWAKTHDIDTLVWAIDDPLVREAFGPDRRDRAFGRNGWIVRDSTGIIALFGQDEPRIVGDRRFLSGTMKTVEFAIAARKPVLMFFQP